MYPYLYYPDKTPYTQFKMAISCVVTDTLNTLPELVMTAPWGEFDARVISIDSIIEAKPNEKDNSEFFRVYRIEKNHKGLVTFYARHIACELARAPVSVVKATNSTVSQVGNMIVHDVEDHVTSKYSVSSSLSAVADYNFVGSFVLPALIKIAEDSGAEIKFQQNYIIIEEHVGVDTGISIARGVNLISLNIDENDVESYDHIMPYAQYKDADGNTHLVYSSLGKYIPFPGTTVYTADYKKVYPLDLSGDFESGEAITGENVTKYYNRRVSALYALISGSVKNITLNYLNLGNAGGERQDLAVGDFVDIVCENIGVREKQEVVKTEFDVLRERYNSVQVSEPRRNLADRFKGVEKEINTKQSSDTVWNNLRVSKNDGLSLVYRGE